MQDSPLVSVIIPVYNVEPYIQAAIESVLQQTMPNFEIVVVDDESPDRSVEVINNISDSRIRLIHQKNRGLPGARNAGIRVARGQYLAFLDGDDIWRPEKLQRHLEHFEARPEVGLSFTRSEFMDQSGTPLGNYQMAKVTQISFLDLVSANPIGNGSSLMMRRALIDELAFIKYLDRSDEYWYFDEDFRHGEDVECWTRVAAMTSWIIEGINDPLTLYRLNAGGLSTAGMSKQYEALLTIVDKTLMFNPPPLTAQEIRLTKAFISKASARNAARFKNGKMALQLIMNAFAYDPRILFKNPQSTCMILGAALLLNIIPAPLYSKMESSMIQQVSHRQKKILGI